MTEDHYWALVVCFPGLALAALTGYATGAGCYAVTMNCFSVVVPEDSVTRALFVTAAFLPFGLLIDRWRWDVFSGKTAPAEYNTHWWGLRAKYQGVAPPAERDETAFDPGAKFHVAASTPYVRYFLARIYQFQFHRALCKAAGNTKPLYECSIYGSKDAGAKLEKMLSLGASKPWPDALAAIGGENQADATAMLEYFAPLRTWLTQQNKGKKCGF